MNETCNALIELKPGVFIQCLLEHDHALSHWHIGETHCEDGYIIRWCISWRRT